MRKKHANIYFVFIFLALKSFNLTKVLIIVVFVKEKQVFMSLIVKAMISISMATKNFMAL